MTARRGGPAAGRLRRFACGLGALPVAILAGGCGSDGTGPGAGASIRVSAATEGVLIDADGFTVTLDGADTRSLDANGSVTFADVAPGTHGIELAGVAANCALSGMPSASVEVGPNETLTVTVGAECGHLIYVHNTRDEDISVVESLTHSLIETLPFDAGAITVHPDQSSLLLPIGLAGPDRIDVLSVVEHELIEQIEVADGPGLFAVTPDAERFVIVHDFEVTVADAASGEALSTIAITTPGKIPSDLALSPDGARAYIPIVGTTDIVVVDVATGTEERRIQVEDPRYIASGPDGRFLYGISFFPLPGVVYVLHTDADQELASTILPGIPTAIAVTPDGQRILVSHTDSDGLTVVDATTLDIVETIPMDRPQEIAITPDGLTAYITVPGEDLLRVFSLASLEVVESIAVGDVPTGLAIAGRE